ncbi:hypothetical protein HMPREF9141_0661 [Prevotella multiformis DSM 16608]|uniref:Uncharacterized protein n=1 Tax=Prevotella multiformis DSM 16608 TaxID=888743 RepID=F0F4Z5_9BACT|nr:hypothetical protein HMPREF9141_0661 [Prevotella multiformis DSM 16608]
MDIVSPLSLLVLYGIFRFHFQSHTPEGESVCLKGKGLQR